MPSAATESSAFLKIPQGVKAAALGGSFVAVADDPSTIFWNPAGLSNLPSREIYSSYTAWFQGTNLTNIVLAEKMDQHTFGIGFSGLSYGVINETSAANPQGTGKTYNPYDSILVFSYANKFANNFRLGANLNYISQNIGVTTMSWQSIDIGTLYSVPNFPETTLGFAYKNILQTGLIQDKIKAGLAYKRTIEEPGRATSYSTTSMDIDISRISNPLYSFGIEYIYYNTIAIRGGLNSRRQQSAGGIASIGLGLLFKNMNVDVAYVPYEDLGNTYRVAIAYKL